MKYAMCGREIRIIGEFDDEDQSVQFLMRNQFLLLIVMKF